jgi:hypothetical protein
LIAGCRLAIPLAAALALGGCAAPEQRLLEQFFGASRLRDTTALQTLSTITFEPREQGIVRTFEITGVTPERVDGQTIVKDVTVEAPVILPDGQTVRKTLVVTLQRATGGGGSVNPWIITGLADVGRHP